MLSWESPEPVRAATAKSDTGQRSLLSFSTMDERRSLTHPIATRPARLMPAPREDCHCVFCASSDVYIFLAAPCCTSLIVWPFLSCRDIPHYSSPQPDFCISALPLAAWSLRMTSSVTDKEWLFPDRWPFQHGEAVAT